jgi:hypothetical protein
MMMIMAARRIRTKLTLLLGEPPIKYSFKGLVPKLFHDGSRIGREVRVASNIVSQRFI